MLEEQVRILQIAVAEHEIRIETMRELINTQNVALNKVSEQLAKLQARLTNIGYAAVAVIAISSEQGGAIVRGLISLAVGGA